ncbi:putative NUDIX family hydrolase [Sclerotinia borealis F-4128]|uniref:Putative NUDIX family hydrolase n=1 Tax=Sclerotinia borealis (strain F-4128) TaxID=1432307 RepID=W9C2W5_SCLBF|nr:putative NUDIX family hydrolase [Sclerotinia borealis F-4128]
MAPPGPLKSDLERQYMSSTSSTKSDVGTNNGTKKEIVVPQPSSSILLISPTNQILLLHRLHTSSSFPSAHVFPGGNLDSYHESPIPSPLSPSRHLDSDVYRLCAIRECFEECGILLARGRGTCSEDQNQDQDLRKESAAQLIHIEEEEREQARKDVHSKKRIFGDWVTSIGAEPDIAGLIPFTRWITPSNLPRRFTTQMYIYFLPLEDSSSSTSSSSSPLTQNQTQTQKQTHTPKSDNGIEHTDAAFAHCSTWLEQARKNEIILFPPQFYLMYLLAEFLVKPGVGREFSRGELEGQRREVRGFLVRDGDVDGEGGDGGRGVKWGDKVICPSPVVLGQGVGIGIGKGIGVKRADGRVVLGLDKQGPELEGSERRGDDKRVVLVKFGKEGPRDVEVWDRREVEEEGVRGEKERERDGDGDREREREENLGGGGEKGGGGAKL